MPAEAIGDQVEKMDQEAKKIRSDTLRMCWAMRGGLNYNEAMLLSPAERDAVAALMKDNIETTNKTGLNYF